MIEFYGLFDYNMNNLLLQGDHKIIMATSVLSKNGTINLPAEIRKKLKVEVGDRLSFVDTGDGIVIVPIKDLFDLIDPTTRDLANRISQELLDDHKKEARK